MDPDLDPNMQHWQDRLDSLQWVIGSIRLAVRQRPDLTETKPRAASVEDTGATDPAIRFVVLALLAVDGILSALAGALLLPFYIGSIPFPISGLISGLVNAALVWAAGRWTRSPRVAALPLWTWLLTVAVMSMGGPGDDVILGGSRRDGLRSPAADRAGCHCRRSGCCGGTATAPDARPCFEPGRRPPAGPGLPLR